MELVFPCVGNVISNMNISENAEQEYSLTSYFSAAQNISANAYIINAIVHGSKYLIFSGDKCRVTNNENNNQKKFFPWFINSWSTRFIDSNEECRSMAQLRNTIMRVIATFT